MAEPAPREELEAIHEEDVATDRLLAAVLRGGVLLAGVVTAFGGLLFVVRHGLQPADHGVFHGEASDLRTLRGIAAGVAHFRAAAIIQLGLVLLIATPVARVALSLFEFAKQRDRTYVVVTTIVLALLIYGFLAGHAAG